MRFYYFLTLVTLASTRDSGSPLNETRDEKEVSGILTVEDLVSQILDNNSSTSDLLPEEHVTISGPAHRPPDLEPKRLLGHPRGVPSEGPIHHRESSPHLEPRHHGRPGSNGPTLHHSKEQMPPMTGQEPHQGRGLPPGQHQQPHLPIGQPQHPVVGLPPRHHQQQPHVSAGQPQHPRATLPPGYYPQQPQFTMRQPQHPGVTLPPGYHPQHIPSDQPQHPGITLPQGYHPQQPYFQTEPTPYPAAGHPSGYPHQTPGQANPFHPTSYPPGPYDPRTQVIQNLELLVMKCLEKLPECLPNKLHLPDMCNIVLKSLGINTCITKDPTKDMSALQMTAHLLKEGMIATKDYITGGAQFIYNYFH